MRIGCSFTRFQTKFFHEKYGDLDSSLISYGPCQTPTLAFVIQRHDAILSFQPQPYWVLDVTVLSPNSGGKMHLSWSRERELDRNRAVFLLSQVRGARHAKVTSTGSSVRSKPSPHALNTVELLKICSSAYGIGPHSTMQLAERLYTQGYISYPRTETSVYPPSFDLRAVLTMQQNNRVWGDYAVRLLKSGLKKPKGGKDVGDHPPITPMRLAQPGDVEGDTWKIYEYICRHFLGTLSGELRYEHLNVQLTAGDEKFSWSGNRVLEPGFTAVMTWLSMSDDVMVGGQLKENDECGVIEAQLLERKTTAPPYLSESDLIGLMEKNGIGTDSSIPQHINNICLRNYVKITSERRLVPTQLGIVLIHGYQRIDPELVLPTTRANVEKVLNEIASGKRQFEQVLDDTIEKYRQKFVYFTSNVDDMDQLFQASFTTLAETGKPFSRCGTCRRYLKHIVQRPQRLYCNNCNQTFALPQYGKIQTFKDERCPLDQFQLLLCETGENSFVFCPQCYNCPPYEDMAKASACTRCTDKNCPRSQNVARVAICRQCDGEGHVVMEDWAAPARWRFVCTKCGHLIYGLKNASRVDVHRDDFCKTCYSNLITAKFDQRNVQGCLFCEKALTGLLSEKAASETRTGSSNRGGRGSASSGRGFSRGRTAGQRGGSRGRGNRAAGPTTVQVGADPNDEEFGGPRYSGRGRGNRGRGGSRGSRGRGRGGNRGVRDPEMDQFDFSKKPGQLTFADFLPPNF